MLEAGKVKGAFSPEGQKESVKEDDAFRGHLCQNHVVCHLSLTTTADSASQSSAAHYSIPL